MGFDALTLRRGTLHVTTADGSCETISDIAGGADRAAQGPGRRPRQLHGPRPARGLRRDASTPGADKRTPLRWPAKLASRAICWRRASRGISTSPRICSSSGQAELATPSLRRAARWFGVPVASADGLNAAVVKGQINWARRTLAIEDAKVTIDGNEAAGALVLNLAGERPLIDGTLAFNALDLTPYAEAARSQSFLFDRHTASWSAFDLSFPIIRHFDADLRISAPKVALKGYGLGRGAATITVRSGKLLADIAELELHSGKVSAQITANANEIVPRYTLRGKIENFDAGTAGAALFGAAGAHRPLDARPSTCQRPARRRPRSCAGCRARPRSTMAEGGRVGLDIKALRRRGQGRRRAGLGRCWPRARPASSRSRRGPSSATACSSPRRCRRAPAPLGLAASGRVDLAERTLDLHLSVKPNAPPDKPLKPADMAGAEAVTRARLLAGALRARRRKPTRFRWQPRSHRRRRARRPHS